MSEASTVMELEATERGEQQVAQDVVRWAIALAGAERKGRVERIALRLGPDAGYTADELELAVRLKTRQTIAEGAEVKVRPGLSNGLTIEVVTLG